MFAVRSMDGVKITVYNSNPRGRAPRDPAVHPAAASFTTSRNDLTSCSCGRWQAPGNASVFAILPMHGENHGAEQQQGRQVGDDHQAVAHVGQGPHRVRLKQAA